MDNKDFLEDYEITGWQISPKTYKFLGIAAALNLFVIIILGQFNLLQTKACDSPYIGKVCEVLDIVSVGKDLAGTNTEFSDQAYEQTKIEEGDVTYIDVSGQEPPFTYPEGYFAIANPPEDLAQFPTDFGSFPTNNGLTTTPLPSTNGLPPQVLPTPNDKVANQPIPDSPFDFGDPVKTPSVKVPPIKRFPSYVPSRPARRSPIRNNSPSKLPNLPGDETLANSNSSNSNSSNTIAKNNANSNTNNSNQPANGEDDGKFNSLPLKDFGDKYGEQILRKQIDINAPFTIEVIGRLDENGKITNAKMQASADSDPKMTEVAKEAILAFSDTKLLKPLYDVGGRDVKITFSQNKDNLQAIIMTGTKSDNDAKRIQSTLNLLIKGSTAFMPQGSDEAALMQKAELNTQGNIFIINFLMPNDQKTQMIEKSLKSLAEKKAQSNNALANSQSIGTK